MPVPSPQTTSDDEISLAEIFARAKGFGRSIRSNWRLLLLPMCIALTAGLALSFGSTPEYSARTRLVPYRSGGGGAPGSLSGLAGLAGIRLSPGGGGESVITTNIYPDLAATLEFREAVATTPLAFAGRDSLLTSAAFFTYERHLGPLETVASYTIGLPGVIVSNLRPRTAADTNHVRPGAPRRFDPAFERIVVGIGERISVSSDKKSGIVTISATMPDPVAAADLVRATSERLTETIISFEVRKADEELRFIEEQSASSKARYDTAQRALAAFADRNRILGTATAQIERDRLSREVESAFELYQQFSREREQARIKRNQDTPVFAVLQPVTVPNQRSSPNRRAIMLVCLVAGLFVGGFRVARRHFSGL